ncbi:hypothetical protein NBRC116589_19700 [Ruegeria sp. HU-ET01832]|uniref:hypothetical protein n=1 Tax=Ruegeria sp. HU-ET01832 TaxID=3135906 RepID=UPI00310281EC
MARPNDIDLGDSALNTAYPCAMIRTGEDMHEKQKATVASGVIAFVVFFSLVAVRQILRAPEATELLLDLDNDAAMRLVIVRDFLAGQGWFDLVQYRLGVDGGTLMHWSRLVDLPIAGLILLFEVFFDRAYAEYLALLIWPLVTLAAAMLVSAKIMFALAGGSALFYTAVLFSIIIGFDGRFQPGSIDHHNVQMVLLLTALLAMVSPFGSIRRLIAGGIAISVSLAIGIENLPLLAVICFCIACAWVYHGKSRQRQVMYICAGIGLGMCVIFLLSAPAAAYAGGFCDALSRDLAAPVILSSGTLYILALKTPELAWQRVLRLAFAFAAVGLVSIAFFPACTQNPLDAIDPDLKVFWLDHVSETGGLLDIINGVAGYNDVYIVYYVAGFFGLLASLFQIRADRARRTEWISFSILLGVALAITVYQIRGSLGLLVLSVFPLVKCVTQARCVLRRRFGEFSLVLIWIPLLAILPGVWGYGFSVYVRLFPTTDYASVPEYGGNVALGECWTQESVAALAGLPKGTVAVSWDFGTNVLVNTPHRVLAAPYHRNGSGILAQTRLSIAKDAETAKEIIEEHGVTYVVTCGHDSVLLGLSRIGYSGFSLDLKSGSVPDFLELIRTPETSTMTVYGVR